MGLLAAMAVVVITAVIVGAVRREERVHREFYAAKGAAGIIIAFVLTGTLMIGNAVPIDGNLQLRIPLQANDGELAQCYIDSATFLAAGQAAVEAVFDTCRNFAEITATVLGVACVHQLCIQYQGIYRFYNGNGFAGTAQGSAVQAGGIHFRGENLGISLAAAENGPLVEYAQTADLNRCRAAQVDLQGHLVVEAHIHGVEAPVEVDRLYIDVNVQQASLSALCGNSPVDDTFVLLFRIKTQIFEAVLISGLIENFPGMDANRLADASLVLVGTRHDFFRHCNTS